MTRDPESVYRATPDKRLPLFEKFDSPSSQERGGCDRPLPEDANPHYDGQCHSKVKMVMAVATAINGQPRGESKPVACNVAASRGAGFGQGSAPQVCRLHSSGMCPDCEDCKSFFRNKMLLQAHARRSDPHTSHEAAKSVRNQSRTKKAIKDVLSLYGPQTDEGIIAALRDKKFSHSGIRTRRREMCDSIPPEVVDSGERRETQSGRTSIVWRLA